MEYCAHCRAIRPTRKSTRRRTVRQPDGTMKILIVDSYHCSRCQHFIGSIEREATPQPAAPASGAPNESASPAEERAAAPGEAPAAAAEEVDAATEAPVTQTT